MVYRIPLIFASQPEGGYTVTSPVLPELVTERDSVEEALANARDALAAVIEAYEDLGRSLAACQSTVRRLQRATLARDGPHGSMTYRDATRKLADCLPRAQLAFKQGDFRHADLERQRGGTAIAR